MLGSGFFGQECAAFLPCRVGRDSCNTCDDGNLSCLRCYNARYLLDGQCVAECPEGYEALGSGNFGRSCRQPPPCLSGRDNCNTCSGDQCVLCYNGKKLFDGECLDECPAGFEATGRGNFGRGCRRVLACEVGRDDCNTCSEDNEQCEKCYNRKYLLNGTCIDACPRGFDAVGRGNFGRECVVALPCVEGRDSCHTCAGEQCTLCYNRKKLFQGQCVEECPEGFAETGRGNFGRGCRETLPCEPGLDNCNTCSADSQQCVLCYNGKKLFGGECVDACPEGYAETGSGNFGRGCREALPCEPGLDNCNTCSDDSQRCTICYNGKRLLDGECVDACPPGLRETGAGNFGRACVEDTGCNHPQCHSVCCVQGS